MIKQVEKFFIENGIETNEARAEAEFLVCGASGLSIEKIITGSLVQNKDEIWALAEKRIKTGAPIQHITGFAYFMGDKFFVNSDVLIPRPETEILVQKAVYTARSICRNQAGRDIKILDIGTGSGCIAIEIAKNLPEFNCVDNTYGIAGGGAAPDKRFGSGAVSGEIDFAAGAQEISKMAARAETVSEQTLEVIGVDISTAALRVAIKNMENLKQQRRVVFRKSDIFSSIYDNEKFDIIVSNPPYIPILAKDTLDDNVKNFDPALALFAQDKDGVEFYRRILEDAKKYLKPKGYVLFEMGCTNGVSQSGIVAEIARKYGFKLEFIEKDLSGIDRVIGFSL